MNCFPILLKFLMKKKKINAICKRHNRAPTNKSDWFVIRMNSYTLYDETRSFACANVSDTRVAFCVCIFLIFVFAISLSHIHNKYTLSPTPFAMNFKHTHQQKHRKKHVLVSSSSIKCGTQLKKKQLFAPRSHCTKNAYNSIPPHWK